MRQIHIQISYSYKNSKHLLDKAPKPKFIFDKKESGLISLIICISQGSVRKKATIHSKGLELTVLEAY